MAFLDDLLAPYNAAMGGAPTPVGGATDPLFDALMPQVPKRGGNGGGRGGPGGIPWGKFGGDIENLYSGVPGHDKSHLHLAAERGPIGKLLKKIQGMGFDVGEHPKFGGVAPVHTKGSHHYSGNAGDINYYGGGRWKNEDRALTWLEKYLNRHGMRTN